MLWLRLKLLLLPCPCVQIDAAYSYMSYNPIHTAILFMIFRVTCFRQRISGICLLFMRTSSNAFLSLLIYISGHFHTNVRDHMHMIPGN